MAVHERSAALPVFTPAVLQSFVERREEVSERTVIKEFVAWLKKQQ